MARSNTLIPTTLTDQEIKDIAIQRVLAKQVSLIWKWSEDEPEATVEFLGHKGIASANECCYVGEVRSPHWEQDKEIEEVFDKQNDATDWVQATIAIRVLNDAIIQAKALM